MAMRRVRHTPSCRHRPTMFDVLESRVLLTTFGAPTVFGGIINPTALAVGVLVTGGKNSIIVAGEDSISHTPVLGVYLNNGNGGFGSPTLFPVAGTAGGIALGDFAGNGRLDVAVVDSSDNQVNVFEGDGLGDFSPGVGASLGGTSGDTQAVAADFTGNGRDDLAVLDPTDGEVAIALSQGNGSFSLGTPITVPQPTSIIAADFNHDGLPDLAIGSGNGSVYIALNESGGNFSAPVAYSLGASVGAPSSIAIADFNGDGVPDLVGLGGVGGAKPTVGVLENQGPGTFGTATTFQVQTDADLVTTGVFSGSGDADIAVLGSGGSLDVFPGNGSGGFTTTISAAATGLGAPRLQAVSADFTGNGTPDIAYLLGGSSTFGSILDTGGGNALRFLPAPGPGVAGYVLPAVTVKVQNPGLHVVTTAQSKVTLSIHSGPKGGQLLGTLTEQPVNGVATFSDLHFTKAGTYAVEATAVGLQSVIYSGWVIAAPAPASLVFTTQPASNAAGATTAPVVEILDQNGHLLTTGHPVVSLSLQNPASGSHLVGTVSVAATNGFATFNNLSLNQSGTYTLKAAVGKVNASSNSFNVTAPVVAKSLAFVGEPASNAAGATIAPQVEILDQYGNVYTAGHPTVTLKLENPPAGARLMGAASVKAVNGIAAFNSLALNEAGSFTLAAVDGTLNATSSAFSVTAPSVATNLLFLQGPTGVAAGSKMLPAVKVEVLDQYGHLMGSDGSTVKLAVVNASAQHTATYSAAAKSGVASFAGIVQTRSGTYTLAAIDSKLQGNATTSYGSGAFVVSALVGVSLRLLQVPTSGQAPAGPFTVLVDVLDKYGNIATGDASTATLTITQLKPSGVALVNATASAVAGVVTFSNVTFANAGTYRLSATDGALKAAVASSLTVIVPKPNIDLANSVVSVPLSATIGKTFSVTFKVTNNGTTTAAGTLPVLFALSDSASGGNAFTLGTLSTSINLAAGASKTVTLSVPVASGSPSGNMYLVAVLDPQDLFDDTNLSNNTAVSATTINFH